MYGNRSRGEKGRKGVYMCPLDVLVIFALTRQFLQCDIAILSYKFLSPFIGRIPNWVGNE